MDIMIKNMVCRHCIRAVEAILEKLGIHNAEIMLGTVRIPDEELAGISLEDLDRELEADGFERISDRNAMIVENIKKTIIRHVRIERDCPLNLSACLEKHLDITYDTASRIFSAQEGRTIVFHRTENRAREGIDELQPDEHQRDCRPCRIFLGVASFPPVQGGDRPYPIPVFAPGRE